MIKITNSLSIIIPLFNEEKRLNKSLIKINKFIKNRNIKVILVNDGSFDSSQEIIKKFIKKKKKFSIINLKKNIGKGGALKMGVMQAKSKWILTMDLDLSVPISQILTWYKKKYVTNKFLIYFGSRNHNESIIRSKIYRIIFGKILIFFINFILNIKIRDTQCGFKLYKRNIGKLLFSKITRNGYEHDIEISMIARNKKILIKELPVTWIHKEGSKVNILIDSIKVFLSIIMLKIRY
jgi:dolichyl-phosphate beta-glucosyltransferase